MSGPATARERGELEKRLRREQSWEESVQWFVRAMSGLDVNRTPSRQRFDFASDLLGIPGWAISFRPGYVQDWNESLRLAAVCAADDGLPFGAAIQFRKARPVDQQYVGMTLDVFTNAIAERGVPHG